MLQTGADRAAEGSMMMADMLQQRRMVQSAYEQLQEMKKSAIEIGIMQGEQDNRDRTTAGRAVIEQEKKEQATILQQNEEQKAHKALDLFTELFQRKFEHVRKRVLARTLSTEGKEAKQVEKDEEQETLPVNELPTDVAPMDNGSLHARQTNELQASSVRIQELDQKRCGASRSQ